MLGFFKRKRCKQCGEELKMFTNVDYCTLYCSFKFNYPNGIDNPWMADELSHDTYCALSDILYEIHKRIPTKLEIANSYMLLPEYLLNEADEWGWDTEVRDKCYVYLKGVIEDANNG